MNKHIYLPFFNEIIGIKVFYKRKLGTGLSNDDFVENIWTYKVVYDSYDTEKEKKCLLLRNDNMDFFSELEGHINKSSIITKFSKKDRIIDNKRFVEIGSTNFSWLSLIGNEDLIEFKINSDIEAKVFATNKNVFKKSLMNYLLIYFFQLSMIQIIELYTSGLDSGLIEPSFDHEKLVIINTDNLQINELMKLLCIFMLDNKSNFSYTSKTILRSTVLDNPDISYLKTIYYKAMKSNNFWIKRVGSDNSRLQSSEILYLDDTFLNISLSTCEFDRMDFKGVIFRKWCIVNSVHASDNPQVIQMMHNTITGERFISLDGIFIPGSYGVSGRHMKHDYKNIFDYNYSGEKLWFKVGDGIEGYVEIRSIILTDKADDHINNYTKGLYRYSCILNNGGNLGLIRDFIDEYVSFNSDLYCPIDTEKQALKNFMKTKKYMNNTYDRNIPNQYYPDWIKK